MQIVFRGLVQCRPPLVGLIVVTDRRLHRWQHHEPCRDGTEVRLVARPRAVQLARDVCKVFRRCHGLALLGTEDAHVADATRARGEHVACQAARVGAIVDDTHGRRRRYP